MKKLILISVLFINPFLYSVNAVETGKFLNFSDLHFNPFYDSTLIIRIDNSSWKDWENIFENSLINSISKYGKDCNYPLLKSSLDEMKYRIPDPDFIIITGDFIAHLFNEKYEHYTGKKDTKDLNSFIEKTIRFVTSVISKHYPDKYIFATVGNDDAYCGNYMIEPGGDFLKMLGEVWEPWVNVNGMNKNFKKDFTKGGYCVLDMPGSNDVKMILLNTVFFSWKYKNQCGDTFADPGRDELEWLESNLERCRRNHQRVYMSYHIPPGADIYSTIHNDTICNEKYFHSWNDSYNEEFIKLINEYHEQIITAFAGHFHRDDFRIFYEGEIPVSNILITPSISPVYDNNPSFKIFDFDKSNYRINNFHSYFLSLPQNNRLAKWNYQYDFNSTYGQNELSTKSLEDVYRLIGSDSSIRNNYIKYYTASNESSYPNDLINWMYNLCGIQFLTKEYYTGCLCGDSLR